MFNLEQIDSDTNVVLSLDNNEFELSEFGITFNQNVDHKGEPQNMVRGGQMHISLSQIVPNNIYEWAMKSTMKNGEVVFKIKSGNAPLKISFSNAYCVNFKRKINATGIGLVSSMVIAPEEITINGISFDNHWVE